MAIPSWPADLPQNILAQGYKGELPNNLLRTSMDVGPAQVRRRGTVAVEPVTGNILVTPTELAALIAFYETTLLDGTLRFKWHGPLEDSMTRLEKTISGVTGIIETADGSAFVDPKSDISEYDGKRIDALDTAGKIASGYIHHNASDDPFVQMTYNAGPSGISVIDNDNIDFGVGNFTLVWKGALPDWTPSEANYLLYKLSGSAGAYYMYGLRIETTGKIGVCLGRNDGILFVTSTVNPSLTDGTVHEITAVITRETASTTGSVIFYVDGVQLGTAVTILAAEPVTINNTGLLYISGHPSRRFASTNELALTYNRALSATEVLSLYQNGIAEADKWGSQTAVYTSDFSAGADGWTTTAPNVVFTGNTDGIGGEDNWLKIEKTVSSGRMYFRKATGAIQNKKYRYTGKVNNPAGSAITHIRLNTASGLAVTSPVSVAIPAGATTIVAFEILNNDVAGRFQLEPSNASGVVESISPGQVLYCKSFIAIPIGATLALEPEGIQTDKWYDSSTNDLDASYPATGYSIYPDGTGVRIASTANGSAYNFSSIEDGFSASGVHTIKIYDYLEMRFTEPPTWNWVDGYYEVALSLEILK